MSADFYRDCPICDEKECVRVDGTHDIDVCSDGTIDTSEVSASCSKCGKVFVNKDSGGQVNERVK